MVQQQLLHRVDPKIWQECAGDSATVLKLNTKLYYFPRGHLEHACPNYPSTQALSLIDACRPFIQCVVSNVDLFADSKTDELVAKLLLTPVIDGGVLPSEAGDEDEDDDDDDEIVSYAKTLTQSDANNGGGFSIPVKCAKFIFPPLDYNTQSPPSQILSVTDFHGKVWNFRHVYAGKPKRHLITHGWSTFSDSKKLVGGDTVVFVKNLAGNITIGLRRGSRSAAVDNISEKAVSKAAELAEKNAAFEVMYYPTVGGFDFVVGTKAVEDAMKINWNPGMSVKYSVKSNGDNSKGCSVFHGTISCIAPPCISPWRMLQVTWNESTALGNLAKVSPWQVEIISNKPIVYLRSPPTKKLRVSQNSNLSISMGEFNNNNASKSRLNQTSTPFNFLKDDSIAELDNVPIENNMSSSLSSNSSSDCNNKDVTYSTIMLFGHKITAVRNA